MNYIPLSALLDQAAKQAQEAQTLFGSLTEAQLNWKPAPDRWSVGQCLDHILTSDRTYWPLFDELASGKKKKRFFENFGFLANFFGNFLVKNATGEAKSKMKAPKPFVPTRSHLPANIVSEFLAHTAELSQKLQATAKCDPNLVVTSPAASLFVYRLGALYQILVGHAARHLLQARKVMEMPEFPKG